MQEEEVPDWWWPVTALAGSAGLIAVGAVIAWQELNGPSPTPQWGEWEISYKINEKPRKTVMWGDLSDVIFRFSRLSDAAIMAGRSMEVIGYRLLRTRLEEPRRYTVSTPTHSSRKKIIKWKKPFCPVGVECKIVEMSPLEYLSKVPSPCREGRTAAEDIDLKGCWSESSIKYITEKVKRGEEIEPPFIDYSRMFRGFPTHEGRHRAFVAYKMDIEKIPVVIFS